MLVRDARAVARQWVAAEAGAIPGARGAYFHGSMNWLPDDAPLPGTSDLDVMVVLDDPGLPDKRAKVRHRNVLLEVSYLPSDAPVLGDRFGPGYRDLLADLGIDSSADLYQRAEGVRSFLPRLRAEAEAIIAVNPAIEE